MRVTVAPIRNASGEVIGGVEAFRDLSTEFRDLERVNKIQSLSLRTQLPQDDRISFSTHYVPNDIIGGDFYAIAKLNADCYGFLLADVTGHGVPAALYTMYLSSLWENNCRHLINPGEFAETLNDSLCHLIKEDEPFAAGVCGVVDLEHSVLRLVGAGNPPALLIRSNGVYERLDCSGLPLGVMEKAPHNETEVDISSGDCLLLFTDGAVEISDGTGKYLDVDGLAGILKKLDYPSSGVGFKAIEEEMLKYSDRIRFDDDLTLLEVRLT
ncbi:MAG: PP2C family protein-serine/threonine phosphatase [Planctomycetota bacterium]|jgi:serine phosphatase RsbU (regulator of sigma subunit)